MDKPEWVEEVVAIGWDLDGTLYPHVEEMGHEVKRMRREALARASGKSVEEADKDYKKIYAQLGSHTKAMAEMGVPGEEFFTVMWDKMNLSLYIKKDPKVGALFEKLKDYRHFLLSNSNRIDQMEKKLALVGLDPSVFEFLQDTVTLGAVKPDPKPFEVCLEKLQLPAEKVLFVGDRDSTDIKGARGVGMRTCMVWNESELADVVLSSVYDVAELFSS